MSTEENRQLLILVGNTMDLTDQVVPNSVDLFEQANLVQDSEFSASRSGIQDDIINERVRVPLKRRSRMYEHYTWLEWKGKWKCNYCPNEYSVPKHGGTGTLTNHMKREHANQLPTSCETRTDQLPSTSNECVNLSTFTKDEFHRKLITFVVSSDQPFSLMEESAFKDFIVYASINNPLAVLPERHTLKKMISQAYKEEKEKITCILNSMDSKVSFTLDCWTSSNGHAFQGVTASWIDENWNLQTIVLDMSLLEGPHTGLNLAEQFETVLNEYNLWTKLLGITTDNASNMGTMFEQLDAIARDRNSTFEAKNHRIRCMAHVINLSCQAALKYIDNSVATLDEDYDDNLLNEDEPSALNIISKIRKAVMALRSSPQRRDMLFRQCNVCNIDAKNLKRDNQTRWNSTLDMLERAAELRQPLAITLQAHKALANLILTETEWEAVDQVIHLLKPFKEATLLLSMGTEPTLSNSTAAFEVLFGHLESYMSSKTETSYRTRTQKSTSYPEWLANAAEAAWNKLKTYYPFSDGLAHVIGTVLDPRYKDKWYSSVGWKRDWINECRKAVRQEWNTFYKNTPASSQPEEPPVKRACTAFEEKIFEQMQNIHKGTTTDELTKYLQESVVKNEVIQKQKSDVPGILGWWKAHQHDYPNLARMAKDYLAISGTGVPVERLFSTGVDLLSPKRQSLSASSVRECMCLKNWLRQKNHEHRININNSIRLKVLGESNPDQ